MIKNLHHDGREWTWRTGTKSKGVYYTDKNGNGIFYQDDRTGETRQLVGTAQFTACTTESGMRRKLNRIFDDMMEDPQVMIRKQF